MVQQNVPAADSRKASYLATLSPKITTTLIKLLGLMDIQERYGVSLDGMIKIENSY